MRNLNRRILILVSQGRQVWNEVVPHRTDDSVHIHEQRVKTAQQPRAKAQCLCLKSVSPSLVALCAFWISTQVNWLALCFARHVSPMPSVHWSVPA